MFGSAELWHPTPGGNSGKTPSVSDGLLEVISLSGSVAVVNTPKDNFHHLSSYQSSLIEYLS
jgi:hypothetical protein